MLNINIKDKTNNDFYHIVNIRPLWLVLRYSFYGVLVLFLHSPFKDVIFHSQLLRTIYLLSVLICYDYSDVCSLYICFLFFRPLTNLSIKWYHVTASARTEIVAKLHKYTLSRYKRVLTIQYPSNVDSGAYQCEAVFVRTNNPQITVSANANITVHSEYPNYIYKIINVISANKIFSA